MLTLTEQEEGFMFLPKVSTFCYAERFCMVTAGCKSSRRVSDEYFLFLNAFRAGKCALKK